MHMDYIIEKLKQYTARKPDEAILFDDAHSKGITYAQLREANPWIRSTKLSNASGKTYKVRIPKQNELYRSKRTFTVYNKDWVID